MTGGLEIVALQQGLDEEHATTPEVAMLDPDGNRRIHRVRELLEEARSGGTILTEESLEELIDLVREIEQAEEN